jgi:hypothetical protein
MGVPTQQAVMKKNNTLTSHHKKADVNDVGFFVSHPKYSSDLKKEYHSVLIPTGWQKANKPLTNASIFAIFPYISL